MGGGNAKDHTQRHRTRLYFVHPFPGVFELKESNMADAEKPIYRGNQAFIDEDYPASLEVRCSRFSERCLSSFVGGDRA